LLISHLPHSQFPSLIISHLFKNPAFGLFDPDSLFFNPNSPQPNQDELLQKEDKLLKNLDMLFQQFNVMCKKYEAALIL
jgi:hypothetical protein